MRKELSRRTFLGSISALGIAALVSRSTPAALPEIEVGAWLDSHPAIANAIVWETVARGAAHGGATPVPFREWSRLQKDYLAAAFRLAWRGEAIELADPPPNIIQVADDDFVDTALKPDDAWRLYVAHIANSLALEAGNRLAWSLNSYAPESLKIIFDSREMFTWSSKYHGYAIDPAHSEWAVPTTPRKALAFLSTNRIANATSTEGAIAGLLEWCRRNLYHFAGQPGGKNTEDLWQYRGFPPVTRVMTGTTQTSDPGAGSQHRTAGCHGTVGFLRATLRAINIPVKSVEVTGHALAFFPTESRYLSHGDDPYNALARMYPPKNSPPFPASKFLIDQAKFNAWFGTSITEAAKKKNVGRRPIELALEALPVYLLNKYCGDLAAKRSHATSDVYNIFKDVYSVTQLETANLWGRMDAEIAKLGGCALIPAV